MNNRITTLIPNRPTTRKPHRLGKLNPEASLHAICAKLGHHLLADLTPEQTNALADRTANMIAYNHYGQHRDMHATDNYPYMGNAHAYWIDGDLHNEPRRRYISDDNKQAVILLDRTPRVGRSTLGPHTYGRIQANTDEDVIVARLEVAVGAAVLVDPDNWRDVRATTIENKKWVGAAMRERMLAAARRVWGEELNRELNAVWAGEHSAGVFEDKKQCNGKHREAAANSVFAGMFRYVEIDDKVDIDTFHALEREFSARWGAGELPRISVDNEIRFRKTMRHRAGSGRAIGLYAPGLRALAVDPRHPESLLHEFAHAYDYEHAQLSLSDGFAQIVDEYRCVVDAMSDVSDKDAEYASTPTEVFARLWELRAFEAGEGGSFIDVAARYRDPVLYAPLKPLLARFDALLAAEPEMAKAA